MAAPNLVISVEPGSAGQVDYLPLAPAAAGTNAKVQISLRVKILNHEAKEVQVQSVDVSFAGGSGGASAATTMKIAAGDQGFWWNDADKNFLLPAPAPATVTVAVRCAGFDSAAKVTLNLVPHVSPVASKSYQFPAHASELGADEFWTGSSGHHWSGGEQLFAYDLSVTGWDAAAKQWSGLLPGKSGKANEDYRVFGKRIYAMADGTVVDFRGDLPNNPHPGGFPDASTIVDYVGNHFYLQHGDELVVYPHLQPGSLNPALTTKNAAVRTGDFLGLVGSSGNASGPHIHIHAVQGTIPWQGPLRPVPFHDVYVIEQAKLPNADRSGPWVKVDGRGLPDVGSAIWPAGTSPARNAALRYDGIFVAGNYGQYCRWGYTLADFQNEEKLMRGRGFRLIAQQNVDIGGGQRRYDGIWNQGNYDQQIVWGWTLDDFKKKAQELFNNGYRLIHQYAYDIGGGQWRYDGIWNPGQGGQFAVWGYSDADYRKKVQAMFDQGYRVAGQQANRIGNQLLYDGIFVPGTDAQFAVYGWSLADFKAKGLEMFNKGSRLRLQQACDIGDGQLRYDGTWRPGQYGQYGVWGWTDDYFRAKVKEMFDAGYRLIGQQAHRP